MVLKPGDEVTVTCWNGTRDGTVVEYIELVDMYLIKYKDPVCFGPSEGLHRERFIQKWGNYDYFTMWVNQCECGSDSVGSSRHSDWCPKYEKF